MNLNKQNLMYLQMRGKLNKEKWDLQKPKPI